MKKRQEESISQFLMQRITTVGRLRVLELSVYVLLKNSHARKTEMSFLNTLAF